MIPSLTVARRKTGHTTSGVWPSPAAAPELPRLSAPLLARPVVQGRYAHLLGGRIAHVVVVDPAVWPFFGSTEAVNEALRTVVEERARTATPAVRRIKRSG